jgi:hypothetical protein
MTTARRGRLLTGNRIFKKFAARGYRVCMGLVFGNPYVGRDSNHFVRHLKFGQTAVSLCLAEARWTG